MRDGLISINIESINATFIQRKAYDAQSIIPFGKLSRPLRTRNQTPNRISTSSYLSLSLALGRQGHIP